MHPNCYIQGTQEWLDIRKTKVTSSCASVLMGCHPKGKTPRQLWQEMKGIRMPEPQNDAMKRGLDLEERAREWYENTTGRKTKQRVVFHGEHLMTSLDAIADDDSYIAEFKVPGVSVLELAAKGIVPEHYYWQCQHHMYVTGLNQCDYVVFDGMFRGWIIPVVLDHAMMHEYAGRALEFGIYLKNNIPPPDQDGDILRIDADAAQREIISAWKSAGESIKALEALEKALRDQIIDMGDDGSFELVDELGEALVKAVRICRDGPTDWKAVCHKWGISEDDLKQFRKQQIGYYRVQSP